MPKQVGIVTKVQLEALSSPRRRRVMDTFELLGSAGVTEVADALGVEPKSLYYHTRILVKIGLLTETETRGSGRSAESVYEPTYSALRLAKLKDPEIRRLAIKSAKSILRDSGRKIESSFERGLPATITFATVRLSKKNRDRLFKMTCEAVDFARENQSDDGDVTFVLTLGTVER